MTKIILLKRKQVMKIQEGIDKKRQFNNYKKAMFPKKSIVSEIHDRYKLAKKHEKEIVKKEKDFEKHMRSYKPKKTLNKVRKTSLAKLKRTADALCGALVRSRGVCEAKGYGKFKCSEQIQWCHIFSRRYQKLRWLPQNAIPMCKPHHVYFTYNPNEWTMFMLKNYNETYQWLYKEKEKIVKIDKGFMENTIISLQAL